MGERARDGAGHGSRMLHREHSGDRSERVEGARAASGPTRSEAREDDRGVPSPERDPYQDEGGEG
jgi:hypothetical protein